jgi:cupin 2 domain-containing protein
MPTGNIFASIPSSLNSELLETLVADGALRIERIVSRGHSSPETGWYDQEQDEWVLLVSGAAMIAYEDGTLTELGAGDYLLIPANTRHRVSWTDPDVDTVWLAVHY